MNGVTVARHGPILKDNEAMGSGKVFKYLRGLQDTIRKFNYLASENPNLRIALEKIITIIRPLGAAPDLLGSSIRPLEAAQIY